MTAKNDPRWVEPPEMNLVTLADGLKVEIEIEDGTLFEPIATQWGKKYELPLKSGALFRTGSEWLRTELDKAIKAGNTKFELQLDGYKVRYRIV